MSIVKRINFLKSNPEKARVKVPYGIEPNCFGTSLWVLEYDKGLESFWNTMCASGKYRETNGDGAFVSLPSDDLPGYVGHTPMDLFLENPNYFSLTSDNSVGNLATIWYAQENNELCGFVLRHSGIIAENGFIFEKQSLEDGIRQDRTLEQLIAEVPSRAKNLQVKFYRPLQTKFN